jgi:diguanylate cyclase (GGDEF)-like protein/PAS domain S-box-containing protein
LEHDRELGDALAKDEASFRALLRHVLDVVAILDADGAVSYVNPAVEAMLGYAPEEVVGTCVFDYVHPEDAGRAVAALAESLETSGALPPVKFRARRADGSWRHVEVVRNNRLDDPSVGGVVITVLDVTERGQADARLKEAEERYRTLVERGPAMTYVHLQTPGGFSGTTYVSPQVETILGYTPEEYTAEPEFWKSIVHPDDRVRVLADDERTGETGEPFDLDFRMLAKDGRTVWIRESGTLVRTEGDGTQVWHGVMFDITELKRVEGELREAEERYRTLVERVPAIIYIQSPREGETAAYDTTYMSPRVEEILGYPSRSFTDDPGYWDKVIHPEDRERVRKEDERTDETGEPFSMEYRMIAEDGRTVWIRDEATLVRGGAGEPLYWLGAQLDVTARKYWEEALRAAEERYRTLVEQIPAVTYIDPVDDPDVSLYTSPQIERMLGYTPEEWIGGKLWTERLHPEDRERVLAADERFEAGSTEQFSEEYRLIARDGSVVWVHEEAVVVRDGADEPLYWQGVIHDVTERREADEALRKNEERLRGLADAAFEGILITDRGEILEANRALIDMFGYAPEEMVGRSSLEFVAPEHQDTVRRKIVSGSEEPYEVVGIRRDGRRLDLEVRGRAFSYRGRSVRVTAVRDVTERKAAERRLAEAEKRYRTLVERIPAVTFVDRMEGSMAPVYVSPQVEKMFGYTPEEWMAGRLWRQRLHPEDRARILASDERFEAEGKPVDQEYRLLAKDGSTVWVHEETVLVRDEAGEPRFVQGIMTDVTQKKRSEERLHHLAFHDHLTGLPNRRLFVDHLKQALQRTRRQDNRVAVLFMDLDGFKVVNDSLGHDVGDLLLTVVAQRLGRCLRPEDTLARFGGDEFVVLLEEIDDAAEAVRVAERITEELRRPFVLEERQLYAAASIGVSLGHARTHGPEGLIREADTAMYRAKAEGCNYCVFDPAMHERALGRLELENDLRRAIEEDEFVVHYQPIVNLQTGGLWGFEALVRWEHPERGLLNPDEFVPVAEESGLVVPMGELVLEEACRQAVGWHKEHPRTPPLAMSVNLSGRQLRRPDLPEIVERALARSGLPASSLGLDITETVYISALNANTAALDRLRALGIRVSLDDFGSGYSSLSYLKRLPADILKIDRSFTRGLGLEAEDTAIVQTIVDLVHILGMEVVAEGVEIGEQETLLREMGCDLAQGYLFSEPLPPEGVMDFLAGNSA